MKKKDDNSALTSQINKDRENLKSVDFNTLLSDSSLHFSRHKGNQTLQKSQDFSEFTNQQDAESSSSLADEASGQTLNSYYEEALKLIQLGSYEQASTIMQKAVFVDLDSRLPSLIVKSCDFWAARLKKMRRLSALEAFHAMHEAWLHYGKNIVREDFVALDRVIYAIRMQVFGFIIEQLQADVAHDQELEYAFALARAYKYRGDYDEAIDSYAAVLEVATKDPAALAELADCYAIIDDEVEARILFREAFFHGADRIILDNLESVMIKQLQKKTMELRLPEAYIAEWMAVYGVIWGLFSYSRELSNSEYARLNHSIHALRRQIEEHPEKRSFLVPRLIYRLFWLIDYFMANDLDGDITKESIEKVLFEIKFLDERVYKKYKL